MFRRLLIKLLFRLLDKDETYTNINDEKISDFLVSIAPNSGFKEYARKRDLQLLKAMRVDASRDNQLILLGQNYELLRMMQIAEEEHKKATKKKQRSRDN